MTRPLRLTADQIGEKLSHLQGWTLQNQKLSREFVFQNFQQAFSFMTEVALVAEKMDHHPEWFNVYSRVKVELTTHDCQGISNLDFELAATMNKIFAQRVIKN